MNNNLVVAFFLSDAKSPQNQNVSLRNHLWKSSLKVADVQRGESTGSILGDVINHVSVA